MPRTSLFFLFSMALILFLGACGQWEKKPGTLPNPTAPTARAVQIEELGASARAVYSGDTHNCVLLKNKTLKCWGDNERGELGINSNAPLTKTPTAVLDPRTKSPMRLKDVSLGKEVTCGFSDDNQPYCWGDNSSGQLGVVAKDQLDGEREIELGEEDAAFSSVPRRLSLATGMKSIVTKNGRQCVISADGSPLCWGRTMWVDVKTKTDSHGVEYTVGEIKHASGVHTTPTHLNQKYSKEFKGPWTGALEVAPLQEDICINLHGNLSCLKNQAATTTNVNALSGGADHICVLTRSKKEVRCAGTNMLGQLGVTNPAEGSEKLVAVTGLPGGRFKKLTAGADHTCILTAEKGEVWCWGSNEKGQLGDPGIDGWTNRPTRVKPLEKAEDISAGGQHTCAVLADSTTWCWGNNAKGQLGTKGQ